MQTLLRYRNSHPIPVDRQFYPSHSFECAAQNQRQKSFDFALECLDFLRIGIFHQNEFPPFPVDGFRPNHFQKLVLKLRFRFESEESILRYHEDRLHLHLTRYFWNWNSHFPPGYTSIDGIDLLSKLQERAVANPQCVCRPGSSLRWDRK